jgi:hypothetical protein
MGKQVDVLEALLRAGRRLDEEPGFAVELAAMLLRVRDRGGVLRPLVANAAQRRFEERRGRQNVVLKARQMGVTTWVAGRFFLKTVTQPGSVTLLVAHTQGAAEGIFGAVQRMWEELPEELREGPLRCGRMNAEMMTFPVVDSEFRVASASEKGVGRGLRLSHLHVSELAQWPGDAAGTLAGLRAALAPEGELVMESTPQGAYGAFYEEWLRGAERQGAGDGVVRHFLPWWLESAYVGVPVERAAMRAEELALVEREGLSEAQIGFRRGLEAGFGVLRGQEFAEDAETSFRATGASCFDLEAVEQRLRMVEPPVETRYGGSLQVWLRPVAGRRYVVAVDAAGGGLEGDFAAVQVVEMVTGLQCAELQQRLRPSELARVSVELAREYNQALLVVERNNHGSAVLAYVATVERYERVYAQGGETGWLTSAASKPEMIAQLGAVVERASERLQSRRLLAECRTFVAGEGGRMAAARGAHDDLVMAMAMAVVVRAEMLVG